MNQLCSQHPQATSNAVKSFTRHHISITGMENSGRIIKSVSTNHRKSEHQSVTADLNSFDFNLPSQGSRDNSAYYKTRPTLTNKATFMSNQSYNNPKFEYQNLTNDFATTNLLTKVKTTPYDPTKNKSIEVSFNNLKLVKGGQIKTTATPFQPRQFKSKLNLFRFYNSIL